MVHSFFNISFVHLLMSCDSLNFISKAALVLVTLINRQVKFTVWKSLASTVQTCVPHLSRFQNL